MSDSQFLVNFLLSSAAGIGAAYLSLRTWMASANVRIKHLEDRMARQESHSEDTLKALNANTVAIGELRAMVQSLRDTMIGVIQGLSSTK